MAPTHSLKRSLDALAFGIKREIDSKERLDLQGKLQELEEQFKLNISGKACSGRALHRAHWISLHLKFETVFPGPTAGMRDPDFDEPIARFGYEVSSKTPVALFCVVREWNTNSQDDVTGVRLAATAVALGHTGDVDFKGIIHASFQGWGAPDTAAFATDL